MKKVFDLIKERLEEQKQSAYDLASKPGADTATLCGWISATDKALEVIGQVEAECKKNGATMITEYSGFDRGVIGRKLPADSTLNNKKKEELIELLHLAQHNYETLMSFYNNAVNVNMEKLNDCGWIPCSERLPKENGYYLITIKYYHLHNNVTMGCFFDDGEWFKIDKDDEVLAWKPLPTPYERKGEK